MSVKIDKIMKQLFHQQVRAIHKNKCFECGVKHGSDAIRTTSGRYQVFDAFELKHLVKTSAKTVKIFLKVLPLDYNNQEYLLKNYAPFCPHHAQQHMKEQIRKIRASDEKKSKGLGVQNVIEVKNWFHNTFGVRPTTKEVVEIFLYFEKIFIKNTDL